MNLFRKLIICKSCGKFYNLKTQRGTEVFICQTRKNYGTCDSKTIRMKEILYMIEKHCDLSRVEFIKDECEKLVSEIIIDKNGNTNIFYKDGKIGRCENSKITF